MTIDGATEIYGIMGMPVSHSLSPAMHNAAFRALRLNKVYVPFPVIDVPGALAGISALGIRGVSVTIPHKQAVIAGLDSIDPVAARIGAVNTLVLDQGKIHGHNTDWLGANRALGREMDLAGKRIVILGAGGSARAIGFGLLEAGAEVVIASRTPDSGRSLAENLCCEWYPLADAGTLEGDGLVNATSVGMKPAEGETPLAAAFLSRYGVVMDIVYAPRRTRLLREALIAGCRVIGGLEMLLYQGAAQFELWTNESAPLEVMRQVLEDRFSA